MQEFQPGFETLTAFLECLQEYLDANDMETAKRGSFLVSIIGPKRTRSFVVYWLPTPRNLNHTEL